MIQVSAGRKREASKMRNGGAIGARPDAKARPLPKAKIALAPRPKRKRKAALMEISEETETPMAASEEIVPCEQEEVRDAHEDKDNNDDDNEEAEVGEVMNNVKTVLDDLLNC